MFLDHSVSISEAEIRQILENLARRGEHFTQIFLPQINATVNLTIRMHQERREWFNLDFSKVPLPKGQQRLCVEG